MFLDIGNIGFPSDVSKFPGVTSFSRSTFGSNCSRTGAVNRSLAFSTIKLTVIADPSAPSARAGEKLTRAFPRAVAVAGGAVAVGAVAGGATVGSPGGTTGPVAVGPATAGAAAGATRRVA